MGHNSRITNINFSHSKYHHRCNSIKSNKYEQQLQAQYHILSGSTDGSARLWKNTRFDQSAILFSHYKSSMDRGITSMHMNIKPNTNNAVINKDSNQRNKPYADTVNYSSFFYMDKFVLIVRIVYYICSFYVISFYYICAILNYVYKLLNVYVIYLYVYNIYL